MCVNTVYSLCNSCFLLGARILLITTTWEQCACCKSCFNPEGFDVQMDHDGAKGLERARHST